MYIQKRYDIKDVILIENHYPGNYGAPGESRSPKRELTPEDIKRQNITNRAKKVQRLILANFNEGDHHLVLSYPKDRKPKDFEEAQANLRKFLGKLRKEYKSRGYEFKYIAVTERGKTTNSLHHHIILEDIAKPNLNTVQIVKKYWRGYTKFNSLYKDGEFEDLADYLVKKETKEEETQGKARYTRSRNLITPKPKKKVMLRKKWPEIPKPKKGYELVKYSLYNGINPVTGYPYQHYTLRRIRGDSG